MTDIDRAVEAATNRAFVEAYEGDPIETVQCIVCEREAAESDSGWVEHPFWNDDGDGKYVDGDALIYANMTKWGFVCGKTCASQAMYQNVSELDRKALDAVLDACRVLSEYGKDAVNILRENSIDPVDVDDLQEQAGNFLRAIDDGEAKWTNRESREVRMAAAIAKAKSDTEWAMCHASVRLKTELEGGSDTWPEWEREYNARGLGSWARIILELEEAAK